MPGKLPTRIGRYEIQGKLGEGAFGRVYKAYDPTVNRWVAIKVLLATDKEVLTRFKNEAMVAGNLRHKNIVTIYEFGEHEGQPFLAMEFLDGQNLQEVMRSKEPRTILQRIAIMSQVAEGLDCAHRSGVVHRDVKPANIMVLPDATVKIMDFGIARLTSDREATRLTQEGNMIGTLLYMAPEQFTPNTEVDALCDIFAYGELYYELLAGKHPFEADEPRVLMYKLNTQHPPPLRSLVPDCPDAMDQVLSRLLAKQRDLRYQSLRDLLYDTQPILIELQQERAATLATEAAALFQEQKLEEANRLMPEILELDPGNRTSHRLREAIQTELRDRVLRPKIDALLKTGREEVERRNFYEAIEAFDSAWRLDSRNIEIQGLLDNARALQEKSNRAAQLVAEARQAFDKQKLAAAYKSASEALLQDPQNPAATRLLQVIQGAIDQKRQQQRLEQALAKAENLRLFQEYEEALAALSEFDSRNPQVGSLIARIRTQKLEHERSTRLQAGMATATELLRNRRLSEAVDHLTKLFADFPETAELRHLLDYARNELAAEERGRAVLRIGAEAQARADSRDFRGALDVLEKALQEYDDSSLVRLLGTVMAAKAAWEQDETIRTTKEQCERLRGEGRLAEAIQAAESAVRSYSADPVLVELLRDLERQREQEKRSQEIRKALGQARKMLDAGEFEKAARYLSDAARQFPEGPEIKAALADAQQALRAQERARAVEACAREVQSAVDRADYESALQVLERTLETYPDESALSRLRDSVIEKRAAWLRKQEVAGAVQRAGSLARSGRFSEASDVLAEALQQFNGEPVLEEARQKLERDWALHQRAQEVSAAARQARTLLDQDQPEAAADFLLQACSRYPAEAELEKLLARAQRAAAVEQVCRDARPLAAQREFGRALQLIEQGLKNWPGELSLVSLQREAAAGLAAVQREEAIRDALRRCSVLAGQEQFADALRLAESSLQTYPGDPGLLAARSEMQARLEEAERLRRRTADLDALDRLASNARSISDASKIGGLREKVRALADRHPSDSEIAEAARNALDQFSTMEEASSLLAKRDFAGALGLSTPYLARIPDHRFFQRLQAEAERGERLVRLAEIRRQLQGEPNLQRKAQLLDAATRLDPNEAWLQQETQVVRGKLGLVNSVVEKARLAEESGHWDDALGQWNALREIYRDYPELDREIARVKDLREKALAAARIRQIEQIQQYVNVGNYDRAGELLQAAERELAGDPRLQPARERIEQVRQSIREAKALAADRKFEQASKSLETALARYPADALLQRQLEDVQQQAERQAALRQEAIRDAVRRSDLLAEQGNFADALRLAETSLDENPGHPDLLAVRKRMQDRLAEAERLRQRNTDLDALRRLDKEAQSITDSTRIGALRENVRAVAGQYPSDPEIAGAAGNTLQRLAAMEDAGSLLAKQDYPAVLAACAKYPDHEFFQLLKSEAERGERSAHLAEAERQVQEEPDLMLRAELLDRTTRLYPDATWLRQESQVVQGKLGQVKALVEKARQAEAAERWDEAIEQWSAVREIYQDYPDLAKEMERVAARKEKARLDARERLGEQIWQHVNAGDYDKAGGLLERAEKEFPGDAEFQFLRGQVASIQQSVREAKALAADQKFAPASKILEEALARNAGDVLLQRELQAVQERAQRHGAREEALATANRLLAGGRLEDAFGPLEEFSARYGSDPEIEQLLGAIERAREAARREAEVRDAATRAGALLSQGDAEATVSFLRQTLAHVQQHPEIRELLAGAEKTLAEQNLRQAVDELLSQARSLSAQEKFQEALQLLDQGVRQFPAGEPAISTARAEVVATQTARQGEEARRRAIQEVQFLVEARQFDQAARAAADALRQFANDPQLLPLSAEIASRQSAWEAEQKEQEIQNACRRADQLLSPNPAEAVAVLTDLCGRNPERADLAAKLAVAREAVRRLEYKRLAQEVDKLCDKGKFAEALRKLDEAGAGSPELPALRQQVQSRLDQATGERVAKALAPARKLIQKNPQDAQRALARLATEFPGRVEISQAVEECRLALLERAQRPPRVPVPPVAPPRGVPKFAWAGLVLVAAAGAWGILTLLHREGVLIVETTPAALVALDGTAAGQADSNGKASIRKAPGRHTLVITKPGFETAEQVVDLKSGSTSRLRLALNPAGRIEATPTPSIASLDPGSVVTLGSAFTLTVTGAGFQSGATVRWNGSDLSTTFTGPTRLQASIPADLVGSRGTANITVVNPGNVVSGPVTLPINPSAPSIAGLSPASATAGGPAFSLTVTGSGFVPGATLQWNGSGLSTTVAGGEEITALVPASLIARPGSATVTAMNPGDVASSPVSFSINPLAPVPTISNLNPGSATAGAPFILTVTGTGFQPGAVVRWNRRRLFTTVAGATQLRAEVPAGVISSPGNIAITVTNPGNVTSGAFNFSINPPVPAPTISGLNPASTTPGAALTLTVNGTGFLAGATVQWNKSSLSTTFAGATQLRATVPANLTGSTGNVAITVVNPGNVSSGPANFSIQPATPTPTIGGINPTSTVAGGSAFFLTVTGSGFAAGAAVQWNQTSVFTTFNSATQLRATVPANLIGTAGSARVVVVNPGNVASNTSTFVINPPAVAPRPPIIWGINPSSATAPGAGFILTVNGSGFQPGAAVHWNTSALQTTFGSTSQLTAAVPSNLITGPGGATITVVNPGNVASGPITLAINPPKADPNAEEIKAVIADFASAMQQLNAGRVVELWPKVPKATRDLLRDVKSGYTFDYKLVITSTPVIEGDQAKVRASRKTMISKGKQTLSETPVTEVVVHLKKSSGKWTITSME